MDFLVSLPTWAVTGIIGGLAGLIGGLIAWSVQHRVREGSRIPQIITTVAVLAGVALGVGVVVPGLENSAAAQCRAAEEGADVINREAGTQIDAVTTAGGLTVDCATRSLVFALSVSVPAADITEANMEAVGQAFTANLCNDAILRDFVADGWTISGVYSFSDGTTRTVAANCAPAVAPPPVTTNVK